MQLINSWALGGAEKIVAMLAMNIDRKRFEVLPCALERTGPIEEDLKASGVNYRVLGLRRRSVLTGPLFVADFWRVLEKLTETLKELSIDMVHAHLNQSTLLAILAARRAGVPRVCATIHNVVFHTKGRFNPKGWLMDAAINRVFSRADRIIGVCEEVTQKVRSRNIIPWERIVTIPNGIEPDEFRFEGDRNVLRQRLGLPIDRPVVVTVGRLTRQKGYPYLLAALALIPAEKRPLTLLVGDGPDRSELESGTRAMGLAHDVRFPGNRRDVPALLAAADLFVLSSLWEGMPLTLLEAMASGLPSVVTAVGGNPGVVENGESGLLVPAADERALAEAICSLLHDPRRREQMGQAARKQFERRFSLRSFVEAHERLYEEMFNEDPKRPQIFSSKIASLEERLKAFPTGDPSVSPPDK